MPTSTNGPSPAGDPDLVGSGALDELIVAASRRLRRRWADDLTPWGLSPHQGRALRAVASDGPLRLGDLADHLRIAARSATEVVDGLVALGLLERGADPVDRRATRVLLTPEGARVSGEVVTARAGAADEMFGLLTPDERTVLGHLLDKVLRSSPTPSEPS